MDKKAILTKAIEKAIANGWRLKPEDYKLGVFMQWGDGSELEETDIEITDDTLFDNFDDDVKHGDTMCDINTLIYDHEFAKALWGQEDMETNWKLPNGEPMIWTKWTWKEHLKNMVVADDPIKYLGEYL